MSRRRTGAVAAIPIAAVLLWGLQACSGDEACAASAPTPALRTTGPKPKTAPRTSSTKQHPKTWGSWGRHRARDDDDCD